MFCLLRTIWRICIRNSIWRLKRRNISINIEINGNYVNLGLLLLFLCNLGSIHGRFIRFVYSVLFSYIKRSKAGDGVQSRLTKLSCTNERLTASPLKRQFFKTTQVSHLFASSWILWWVFCGNNFGKLSALGNLACAQETRWLRVARWTASTDNTLLDLRNSS